MAEINKRVIIMVGIPGSGKSTWVEQNFEPSADTVVINADSIRKEWYGDPNIQGDGKKVFDEVFKRFEAALKSKTVVNIVVDNTSVTFKSRKSYYNIIEKIFGEDFSQIVEIDVVFFKNFNQAKERNKNRERVVPEDVLDKMIGNFEGPTTFERQIANIIKA